MAVDAASFGCARVLPVRTIESSRALGWRSALVEHQQVLTHEEPFDTLPTPDHTLVVMTRGEQRLETYEHGTWHSATYRPGAVGITPGGVTDRLRRTVNRDAGPACKVNIYIPPAFLDEAADQLGIAPIDGLHESIAAHGEIDDAVRHAALALVRALREGASEMYVERTVRWLVAHILTFGRDHAAMISEARAGPILDRRMDRARDHIRHHYADPLSIDLLAGIAGVSKFHFVRLFRQATGATPYRYILDQRFDAASRLLGHTDLSITEIARRCGFPRANHFSTQFMARFGLSPSDYRLGRQTGG